MFLSTNAQEVTRHFEPYVQKFQNLFDMHAVAFGSPEDLHGFMEKLTEDKHLAMDFWALTGFLSNREDGHLSDQEMLAIIVFSVGGADVPASDSHINQLIADIASLLAGVDVPSPRAHIDVPLHPIIFDPNVNPRATRYSLQIPPFDSSAGWNSASSERHPRMDAHTQESDEPMEMATKLAANVATNLATNPAMNLATNRDAGHSGDLLGELSEDLLGERSGIEIDAANSQPSPSGIPPELNETLSRLEHSSRELKLHLDIIDNRVSRMEPHLDGLSELVYPIAKSSPPAVEEPAPTEQVQVQMPAPASTPEDAPSVEEPPVPAPVVVKRRFFQSRSDRNLALYAAAMVLLAIAGGAFLHHEYSADMTRIVVKPMNTNAGSGNIASATAPAVMMPVPTPPSVSHTAPQAEGRKESAARSSHQSRPAAMRSAPYTGQNAPANASSFARDGGPSAAGFGAGHISSEGQNGQGKDHNVHLYPVSVRTAERPSGYSGSGGTLQPITLQPIKVSSGVMASKLIASSSPDYPRLARIAHIQGPVVLQAIISRDGTVDQLRVVQGHRLLRHAAEDAVSTWRYRPYLLNGKPAEVSTLVTVDFNLHE